MLYTLLVFLSFSLHQANAGGGNMSGLKFPTGFTFTFPPPTPKPTSAPTKSPTGAPTPEIYQTADFVETIPDIPQSEVEDVMNWIKAEVVAKNTDYCWKDTYDRGVGLIPDACPPGKELIGALCYTKCPAGYLRFGFDCHQTCPRGFQEQGLFCRKLEYGRGAGYPWSFFDGLTDAGMFQRCQKAHGKGKCEKWGAIVYPKCKPGFYAFGCCICRPHTPNCAQLGMGSQFDLSCGKKIIIGDPTPMICSGGLEMDAGLCYQKCSDGYYGVAFLCWAHCASTNVDCAAACAKDEHECAIGIIDHVISVLALTANVVTLGLATPATAGAVRAFKIAGKTVEISKSNRLGNALADLAESLQTIKATSEQSNVVRRVVDATTGSPIHTTFTVYQVEKEMLELSQFYRDAYAADFENQTTPKVASTIDTHYTPETALFLKGVWADMQFDALAEAEGWKIASTVLTAVSIVDVTGVTGVLASFAKDECEVHKKLPCISADISAKC